MKKLFLLSAITITGLTAAAQSKKIDLSKDPGMNKPVAAKTNAELLKESRETSKTDSLNYKIDGTSGTNVNNNAYMTNDPAGGRVNSNSQQYKLNNGTKMTNEVYYDDAGKVKGANTSFEFGKKKK